MSNRLFPVIQVPPPYFHAERSFFFFLEQMKINSLQGELGQARPHAERFNIGFGDIRCCTVDLTRKCLLRRHTSQEIHYSNMSSMET
jgi:hypothetical protein